MILSTGRGCLVPGGICPRGVSDLGGGSAPREGCLVQGGCLVPGGLLPGGLVPGEMGVCVCLVQGGAWWRPSGTATAAGGTHPTGMHSCFVCTFAHHSLSAIITSLIKILYLALMHLLQKKQKFALGICNRQMLKL